MSPVAIAQSTFAIAVVALLFGLFLLLLTGSFLRARRAAREAAGETPVRPAPADPAPGPRPRTVISRRDFFRTGLLSSFLVFMAQFGGASLAFLWPNLRGGFGSLITLPDPADSIKAQIREGRQPYYFGAGRFYLINYTGDGDRPGGPYEGITADGLMAIFQ